MKKRNQPVIQPEPVIAPSGWEGEERRFAIRLARMTEQLFIGQKKLAERVKKLEEEHNAQI